MRRLIAYCVIFLTLFSALTSCSDSFHKNSGAVWGTVYNITYKSDRDLGDSILATMRRVELSTSMYDSLSTVSAVNRGQTTRVDPMFAEVFRCSQRVQQLSGGAFDPTVMPLVELWGFGRNKHSNTPDSAAIAQVLTRVGIDRCRLEGLELIMPQGVQMHFDFSAIAKGYGVDCVADMLQRNGVSDYLVEIGGEIRCAGSNPHGQAWNVQIDAPVVETDGRINHQALLTMQLRHNAVATSGNYRNWRQQRDGSRVGHTIDPKTGRPVTTDLLSVTVLAPTCMEADALATACMAMGYQRARTMIDALPGTEAIFVRLTPAGQMEVIKTEAE